jgi:hypothetical protein
MKIFFIFLGISLSISAMLKNWEKIQEKDGISVFQMEIPGTDNVAFRGEMMMNVPIEKIFSALSDESHLKDWVDHLKTSKVLEIVNEYEAVIYQEISIPWPFKNRDFVFRVKAFRNGENKVFIVFKSEVHPNAPPSVGVRGEIIEGSYTLTPIDKSLCKLELEIISDPKGAIPKWLVHLFQKNWPYVTLTSLLKVVEKPYIKDITLPGLAKGEKFNPASSYIGR